MGRRLRRYSGPELVTIVFGVILGIALIYAASTSAGAFGAFNPSWEGTSELRTIADESGGETTIVRSVEEYDDFGADADGTIALIIEPEGSYNETEQEQIREFVEDGGTVLIAESSGQYSNPLLETLGATTRIDGDPLRDERNYYRSPLLPVATETAEHPYTNETDSLTLNYGSALEPGEATVLVRTSDFAYLDRNQNNALDPDENLESYPVVTIEEVGEGQVITVSDSSVFTNVMMDRPGNRAFATSVLGAHDHVILDGSQDDNLPPIIAGLIILRESAVLQLLLGGGLVLGLAALARRPDVVDRASGGADDRFDPVAESELTPSEMRSQLSDRYPDWTNEKREEVITAIIHQRDRGEE